MEALNQKEREFAEEHHALIYAFLRYYHLPEAEYYDLLAIAYLRAVKEYNGKPELRGKYEFSTIAFQKMRDAKIKKYHADRVRDAYIAFSLNDLNAEGNEYMAQLPDPLFAVTIGSLVGSLIEVRQKESPMAAAFTLHEVSRILEAKSKSLVSGAADRQKEAELGKAIEEFLKAVLSR